MTRYEHSQDLQEWIKGLYYSDIIDKIISLNPQKYAELGERIIVYKRYNLKKKLKDVRYQFIVSILNDLNLRLVYYSKLIRKCYAYNNRNIGLELDAKIIELDNYHKDINTKLLRGVPDNLISKMYILNQRLAGDDRICFEIKRKLLSIVYIYSYDITVTKANFIELENLLRFMNTKMEYIELLF